MTELCKKCVHRKTCNEPCAPVENWLRKDKCFNPEKHYEKRGLPALRKSPPGVSCLSDTYSLLKYFAINRQRSIIPPVH